MMSTPSELEPVAKAYLAVKAQIDALEESAAALKEEIDVKVQLLLAEDPTHTKWAFEEAVVTWVAPSERTSIDRSLLVQHGMPLDVLEKSTVKKTAKGYTKVSVK